MSSVKRQNESENEIEEIPHGTFSSYSKPCTIETTTSDIGRYINQIASDELKFKSLLMLVIIITC